ncbi:MAG: amino acid-binding protein [Lachnospiraceae bacterium]|nr:amino acid-binding protein [Lachnospiraceae bacterium]
MKQVSVFLENSAGRLQSVLAILKNESINIVSLSIADNNEYGMLRMIVSDAEKANDALKKSGFSSHLTDVLAIKLPHTVGSLADVLDRVAKAGINIEYMYALSTKDANACIVFKPTNKEDCINALDGIGLNLVTAEEVENF